MYLLTHACPQGPKFGNKVSVFCILYKELSIDKHENNVQNTWWAHVGTGLNW